MFIFFNVTTRSVKMRYVSDPVRFIGKERLNSLYGNGRIFALNKSFDMLNLLR